MISCNITTDLEYFYDSRQHRSLLKRRSRLPRSRHSETSQVTYQKNSGTHNSTDLGCIQKNLVDYRLKNFLTKSRQVIDWYTQSKLELAVLIKEIRYQNPEIDGIPCSLIEEGIEEQYSKWKCKVDTFYKTTYTDLKISLDRLFLMVPVSCLKRDYTDAFITYQRIYQLDSEFMRLVDYAQKVYTQRHQINDFMDQVRTLTLEIERHLRCSKIDVEAYNTIKEKVATVVMNEYKQITYPEAPYGHYDSNYYNYMYVSSHKVKLIELNQKLDYLV